MKRILSIIAFAVIVTGFVAAVLYFQKQEPTESVRPQIAATIFPLYDITRTIAGDRLNAALILTPGSSPHTFEPAPSTLRQLSGVQTVYAIGNGLDRWADQIVEATGAQAVVVDSGINIRETAEGSHDENEEEDTHGHGSTDPHYYLTSENAKQIARNITQDLSSRFPEHEQAFRANLQAYLVELDELDRNIRLELDAVENPDMVTLHDAWYYFADSYGLNIVGTFEPTAGREPSPRYLVELMQAIEQSGSRVLYSEPQLATENIKPFANDNDLRIVELDPIGGTKDSATYIELMLSNARIIAQNQ